MCSIFEQFASVRYTYRLHSKRVTQMGKGGGICINMGEQTINFADLFILEVSRQLASNGGSLSQ